MIPRFLRSKNAQGSACCPSACVFPYFFTVSPFSIWDWLLQLGGTGPFSLHSPFSLQLLLTEGLISAIYICSYDQRNFLSSQDNWLQTYSFLNVLSLQTALWISGEEAKLDCINEWRELLPDPRECFNPGCQVVESSC